MNWPFKTDGNFFYNFAVLKKFATLLFKRCIIRTTNFTKILNFIN